MNKARKVRYFRGFPGGSGTKNPPKSHGDRGDMGGKGEEVSLPLVLKGRWQAAGLTEGIRTSSDRGLTTPQSAFG